MYRLTVFAGLSFCFYTLSAVAQTSSPTVSDPLAISLAQKSVAVLTGGTPITDVTLNASVTSVQGSDIETGTGTFRAKGGGESRVDLNLSNGTRSDVRSAANGIPTGSWVTNAGASSPYAQHNCWTDAAWFYPGLSSLTQTANPSFVFSYLGQEQRDGISVQHIHVFRIVPGDTASLQISQHLAGMDFYLDVSSYLPLDIAFQIHADNNMNTDLSTELRFANYQTIAGFMTPLHFQQLVNGGLALDVTVTTAVVNSGLLDSVFSSAGTRTAR